MTIIVAVIKNGRGAIAADTAENEGGMLIPAGLRMNASKLLRYRGTWIGTSGWSSVSSAFEAVLQNADNPFPFGTRGEIFTSFQAIHDVLKKDYFIETQEDKDQPVESSQNHALILSPTGIFDVESYRSVGQYRHYWAIGSGRQLALGALHALYDRLSDPRDIARAAAQAACALDDSCLEPIDVKSLTLEKNKK